MNADTLLYRLHLKSQIARWRLLAVLAIIAAMVIVAESTNKTSPITGDYIARLSVEGLILDDRDFYDLIDEVGLSSNAKALIVWVDTPGGSAVAGEEIFLRLREIARKKPVVAVMREVAASAGYMVALGADHIIAREGTITGSIGVMMETFEATELAEKLGIEPVVIKTSPLKAAPNPLEKTSPEARQVIQTVIDDFYDRFVEMVAKRRNLPKNKVIILADGRVYSGRQAVENKLIDEIGGENEALVWLQTQKKISKSLKIKDIELQEEDNFLNDLVKSTSKIFFNSKRLGLDGMAAIWHPELH